MSTVTQEQIDAYTEATGKHRQLVMDAIAKIAASLMQRAVHHDNSKLQSPELEGFAACFSRLRSSTYGAPDYIPAVLQPTLEHHYAANRHHPEHFKDGINEMTLVDLVEMFADWVAAVQNHDNGDIYKSIEINTKRFNLPPMLVRVLQNTARDVFNKPEPT